MRSFAVLAIAAGTLFPLRAQDGASVKIDVNVVNVLCNVRDKRGAFMGNLDKSDFTIYEDGKRQEIKYFNRETDLPLTIGLLIDSSASQANLIESEKISAYRFFGSVLRPKDLAFLISFAESAELLQDYTNSAKLLQKGLGYLHSNASLSGGMNPGAIPVISNPRVLNDAVYLASAEQLRGQVGRKVLVMITAGDDRGSRSDTLKAIEATQKADAVIYGLYHVDPEYHDHCVPTRERIMARSAPDRPSDATLRRLADETGGHVYHIDKKNTLDDAFKELQDAMRSQYAIGYTPMNPAKDGTFRHIEIRTTNKDWKVQARKGYYAVAAPE
jgi:VWFA-related protein